MSLAHVTHAEFPLLLVLAAAAAGCGIAIGVRMALRAMTHRKG